MAFDRELLRRLPRVLRARDFHLYLEGGKRLTDLWLDGGRAVLGHKPPRVLLELKNAAERGLFTPLPHPTERRLIKALGEFFPDRAFRLYADFGALRRALEKAGFSEAGGAGEKNVSLWRPFLELFPAGKSCYAKTPILIPVLPWPLGPAALVLEKSLETSFPAGDLIPPVLLAPAARALYDLAAKIRNPDRQRFHKIEKALRELKPGKQKAGALSSEGSLWRRCGIYLTVNPEMDREKYASLFRHFLDGGFLIPPSPGEPAILPASMSKGEETKLAELLSSPCAKP